MASGHDEWDVVSGVGLTALAAAATRSLETFRPNAWVSDPYAEHFVRAADPPRAMPTRPEHLVDSDESDGIGDSAIWAELTRHMATRSRFFDQFFAEAGQAGVRQAVVLAAGLDCRSFRLAWPTGTVVYEIDQPAVLAFKRDVLTGLGAGPACERREVATDLREDWALALTEAGFDTTAATVWLAEGLLPYLSAEAEDALLSSVTRCSAPGSWLAVEDFTDATDGAVADASGHITRSVGGDMTQLLYTDPRPNLAEELRRRGWQVRVDDADTVATSWGRARTDRGERGWPSIEFVTGRC